MVIKNWTYNARIDWNNTIRKLVISPVCSVEEDRTIFLNNFIDTVATAALKNNKVALGNLNEFVIFNVIKYLYLFIVSIFSCSFEKHVERFLL